MLLPPWSYWLIVVCARRRLLALYLLHQYSAHVKIKVHCHYLCVWIVKSIVDSVVKSQNWWVWCLPLYLLFPCHIKVLPGPFIGYLFCLRLINSVIFHIINAQIRYAVVWNSAVVFVMGGITWDLSDIYLERVIFLYCILDVNSLKVSKWKFEFFCWSSKLALGDSVTHCMAEEKQT